MVSSRRLWLWASFVARQYSHRRTAHNPYDCQIVSQLCASHGSRFPLAFVVRTGNQELAKRLGESPNRPVWSGAAVQAPKEGRSLQATTRCIKGMSSNGANRPTQRPRVGNVWPRYWLSNRRAKTRHITSQSWDAAGAPRRWASFCCGPSIRQGLTMDLLRSQSISGLCDRHGPAILLALDGLVRTHFFAGRFGAPPNGPVWTPVPFRCR